MNRPYPAVVETKLTAILLVLLMVFMVQCSSFVRNTYGTLGTAAVLYDSSMKAVADLYDRGMITEEEKAMAISIGRDYYNIYMAAVTALELYKGMSGSQRDAQKMRIIELLEKLGEIGGNLSEVIQKYSTYEFNPNREITIGGWFD